MYGNIIVYQNIYAVLRAVYTRAQVQRLEESRLTIWGDGDQDPVFSESYLMY